MLVAILALATVPVEAGPPAAVNVSAAAGILVDGASGRSLWERNPDLPLPPASTTKVLTALVAARSAPPTRSFRVSAGAAMAHPSKINLRRGWSVRRDHLLYALLLQSANDAAEVLAEGVAGSVPAFARRMNREARRLGATRSHFVNPHGLPAAGHVSTARDLVAIFREVLREPALRRVLATKTKVIRPTTASRRTIVLRNRNRLLGTFKVAVLGKTGWTRAAKKCFVGVALANDGRQLFVAVLGSRDLWGDVTRLLNYGLATDRDSSPAVLVRAAQAEPEEPPDPAAGDSDDDVPPPSRVRHAPTAAGAFTVQLASFLSPVRAKDLRAAAAAQGYAATISRIQTGESVLYRVTIPGFRSTRQARTAAAKMRSLHGDLRPLVTLVNG